MKRTSGSSLRERRIVRSDERTKDEIEQAIAETERRIDAMTDDDIDYSDIPPITDFTGWERNKFYRPVKEQVTLRLDRFILEWFKQNHDKYQTAINAALIEHIRRKRVQMHEESSPE